MAGKLCVEKAEMGYICSDAVNLAPRIVMAPLMILTPYRPRTTSLCSQISSQMPQLSQSNYFSSIELDEQVLVFGQLRVAFAGLKRCEVCHFTWVFSMSMKFQTHLTREMHSTLTLIDFLQNTDAPRYLFRLVTQYSDWTSWFCH